MFLDFQKMFFIQKLLVAVPNTETLHTHFWSSLHIHSSKLVIQIWFFYIYMLILCNMYDVPVT